jgi:lysophospholipase L1-like esterase
MEALTSRSVVRRKPAIAIWLFQLVFPTAALIPVLLRLSDYPAPGVYTMTLLGLALAWYAGCLAALGLARTRSWILGHSAQLTTLYVTVALGLVAMEMFYRYKIRGELARGPHRVSQIEYSREMGWNLIREMPGVGEHGWRGPFRSTVKPEGRFRIVCLGDSTTHGHRCPWDEAWPAQLEALLNQDANWRAAHGGTEVVNLGVPGYGTDQELLALQKHGLSYHPDLVILQLSVTDFADVSFDHDWRMFGLVTRYKPFYALEGGKLVLKRDYAPFPRQRSGQVYEPGDPLALGPVPILFDKSRNWLEKQDNGHPPNGDKWATEEAYHAEYSRARPLVWALMREIASTSAAAGSRFLLTIAPVFMNAATDIPPMRVGSLQQDYGSDAAAAGVVAINCVPEYFAQGGNARFDSVTDRGHLNKEGNELVARHTMKWLKENMPPTRSGRVGGGLSLAPGDL